MMALSTFFSLFKTQIKCPSPVFNINQEPVHARKWAVPGTGGTKMSNMQLRKQPQLALILGDFSCSCYLLLSSEDLQVVPFPFASLVLEFSTTF